MAVSKYETKAQKELEADGWVVDYKRSMTRFAKLRDFFGLFDLVAVKKDEPIRFIAIKGHHGGYNELTKRIEDFWMPACCTKELWRWPKTKQPKWDKRIIK